MILMLHRCLILILIFVNGVFLCIFRYVPTKFDSSFLDVCAWFMSLEYKTFVNIDIRKINVGRAVEQQIRLEKPNLKSTI